MESLEAAAIRNYLREKKLKTLKGLMKLYGGYSTTIKELQEKRRVIGHQRKKREITFREYWDTRVNLDDSIRDIEKKRNDVVKQIATFFSKKR